MCGKIVPNWIWEYTIYCVNYLLILIQFILVITVIIAIIAITVIMANTLFPDVYTITTTMKGMVSRHEPITQA